MNIGSLVSLALLAIVAIILIVNILKGVLRGLKKTFATLIAIIVSALVAWLITSMMCSPTSKVMIDLVNMIYGFLPDGAVRDLFAMDAMNVAVSYYTIMLVAPIVFLAVYVVASIIFGIVCAIIMNHTPILDNVHGAANRWSGLALGLVCGFLVVIITMAPFVGTIDLAGTVAEELNNGESEESNEVLELVETVANDPMITTLNDMGCGSLYNVLASAKFEGEKVYLKNEVTAMLAMIEDLTKLGGNMSDYGEEEKQALCNLVVDLDSSPIIKYAIAGIFAEASETWLEGNEYMGMSKFSAGEMLDPLVNKLLAITATTDKDTVGADLETMADIFIILIDSGIVNDDGESTLDKLSQDGVIADLIYAVSKNERMSPLADEITDLSVRALASTLGIPENAEERYNMLMDEIANVLVCAEGHEVPEMVDSIRGSLAKAFDDYGVAIGDEALEQVATGLIADLVLTGDTIEGSDVKEFFAIYVISRPAGDADSGRGGLTLLSNESNVTFNGDGTISYMGTVLKRYNSYNYADSYAAGLGSANVSIDDAAFLDCAENMVSSFLTLEDILECIGSYSDCSDLENEVEKVADILKEVFEVFSAKDLDDLDYSSLMEEMGGIFDLMADSAIFGDKSAESILTAILQSDKVLDSLGLSRGEMTDFANKLHTYAQSSNGNYADATAAVAGTVDAVNKVTDKNATDEEKLAATEHMLNNVNKGNAEMITSMITDSMVGNLGVGMSDSATVASSVQSLINNMAEYNEGTPDSESVAEEARAVTQILSLAMVGTGSGPMFDADGEKGSVGSTPDEFISTVVNSDVVMNTVSDTVDGKEAGSNPYGVSDMSEQEKNNIESALENYYNENGGGEELATKLGNLAIILNVDFNTED